MNIFQFPEVRVVEASAGSGKTFALAKRYVQLLLNPRLHKEHVPIRHILAITFTNKAAFEMKARILDFLKKIALRALSKEEEKALLDPLKISREEAAVRAFAVMEELIHHYNFFQVQTIDSFINALLSGCAFKIGLSANFRIRRNSFDYLEYSLDRMIEQAAHDEKTFKTFAQFLHQYLFLENRTGWFPKKDMLALLTALHYQSNIYGMEFLPYDLKGEDLIIKKRQILSDMRELKENLPEGTDARFVKILESFLEKYKQGFDFDKVSNYFARLEIPVGKSVQVPSAVGRLWKEIYGELCRLCEAEAYSLFNPYVEVFKEVTQEFRAKAAKDDVLFLEELNKRARSLFDEGRVTVQELYYRLATRFHHYLIDEFQDTSVLQWENLYLMIEEALSTGGSLFYVGDKKQAIYGFRGGEVRLFDRAQEQFAAFNVQHEKLSRNYRSRGAIVEFNNKIFSPENLQRFMADREDREIEKKKKEAVFFTEKDRAEVLNVFHAGHQEFLKGREGGYVKVEYVAARRKEDGRREIRERLLRLVKDLGRRFAYADMAILTRGNQEVEEVTSWLMEEGIFAESERTLNIGENRLVREIISFLKFLDSPIDNLAFADFILGGCFAKATGISSAEMHAFVFSLRKKMRTEKDFYIYRELRKTYPKVWNEFFDEFFKNIGLYPLYELTVTMIARFRILESFPQQQGFLMRFLELIREQEEETTDTASFLESFEKIDDEKLFVNVSDSDAIKILTIHKSKGLEFPVVILPFLEMDIHIGSGGSLGQQSYLMDFQEDGLQLLRIKNKYLPFSETLADIHHREFVKSFISELNNVYVGLTRAGEELYVFVPERSGGRFNPVNLLIPEEALEFGRPLPEKARPTVPESRTWKLPLSRYYDWIDFLKEEFTDVGEIFRRREILKGNILHFILSCFENIRGADVEKLLQEAVAQAKIKYPFEKDWPSYQESAAKILRAASLRPFFEVDDGDVFRETDIVDADGRAKRLDRLIIKEKEVWVADYKTKKTTDHTCLPARQGPQTTGKSEKDLNTLASAHREQVKEYMRILSGMYPDKEIKGWIIYLDNLERKEIKNR